MRGTGLGAVTGLLCSVAISASAVGTAGGVAVVPGTAAPCVVVGSVAPAKIFNTHHIYCALTLTVSRHSIHCFGQQLGRRHQLIIVRLT